MRTTWLVCVCVCPCAWGELKTVKESNKRKWWWISGATYAVSVRLCPSSFIVFLLSWTCSSLLYVYAWERGGSSRRADISKLPLSVSRTSSIRQVIAHCDLCPLTSPLITFTFCYCHCSDRQPTKVPPVKHPSFLHIILAASKETLAIFHIV